MSDYTSKHKPDPKWTPNLNALVEFMRAGEQARAAASELTKLKALAALAEEIKSSTVPHGQPRMTYDQWCLWISRYDAITKDGGK